MELKEGDSIIYEGIEYLYDGECAGNPLDCHISLPRESHGICVERRQVFTFANWVRLERKKAGYGT